MELWTNLYSEVDEVRSKAYDLATDIRELLVSYTLAAKELENKGLELGTDVFEDYDGWVVALEEVLNKLEEEGLA